MSDGDIGRIAARATGANVHRVRGLLNAYVWAVEVALLGGDSAAEWFAKADALERTLRVFYRTGHLPPVEPGAYGG